MPDIDLIPPGYREALRLRRWIHHFSAALVLALLTMGAARAAVAWLAAGERPALERLRASQDDEQSQQAELQALQARIAHAAARADLLSRMREGVPAHLLFTGLDRALDAGVRFSELQLTRSVTLPPATPPGLPAPAADASGAQVKMAAFLGIRGEATSHAALADFVRALAGEPGFATVRIVSARRAGAGEAVQFEAEAALRAAGNAGT